jgi:hypothetical protein
MAYKRGRSEKKTDWLGNKYIQHYDSKGNKSGKSVPREGFFGNKYTQHYDAKGEKSGRSEKKEGFFGNKYTQKYNSKGEKSGRSEKKEGFFGNKYTQHYDAKGNKTDRSVRKEGFWGNRYVERSSDRPETTSYGNNDSFKGSGGGSSEWSGISGSSYGDSSSASGFGLAFLILVCIIIGIGVVSVVINKTRDGYRSEPFMNRSDTPIKSESEQMRERDEPYRKAVSGKSESDKEAIAAIYLTRPYEYECDINAVDKQITYYDNFVQQYPGSIYVPEALMRIAWHQLYALQCDINEADKLARIEKAKICYRKIYTESKNDNWRTATTKLIDVLTNSENELSKITIEHAAYDEVLAQHSNLLNQLPLCSRN